MEYIPTMSKKLNFFGSRYCLFNYTRFCCTFCVKRGFHSRVSAWSMVYHYPLNICTYFWNIAILLSQPSSILIFWRKRRDSNPGHHRYQADMLPTELSWLGIVLILSYKNTTQRPKTVHLLRVCILFMLTIMGPGKKRTRNQGTLKQTGSLCTLFSGNWHYATNMNCLFMTRVAKPRTKVWQIRALEMWLWRPMLKRPALKSSGLHISVFQDRPHIGGAYNVWKKHVQQKS